MSQFTDKKGTNACSIPIYRISIRLIYVKRERENDLFTVVVEQLRCKRIQTTTKIGRLTSFDNKTKNAEHQNIYKNTHALFIPCLHLQTESENKENMREDLFNG